MASILSDLINLGLSEKEAKVYLASLELGSSSVAQIAKESKVNRATTYVILEALAKMGLVGKIEEDKKTFYAASHPESLERIFEIQLKDINERRKSLEKILPDLRLVDNKKSGKPIIKFYEGREGSITSNYEIYSQKIDQNKQEPIRLIYPKDKAPIIFSKEEMEKARKVRLEKKIKSKVLCTSSGEVTSTEDGDRLKIPDKYKINADIDIYGEMVRIASLGKKLPSILIKDKDIAETFKSIFELAWEGVKSLNKKK